MGHRYASVVAAARRDERDEDLRKIRAMTDSALSLLDTEALFSELLRRIQVLLRSDTAAILLLDHDTSELFAAAAIGLAGPQRPVAGS